MSRIISPVNTSDTFQVWLQRTNDLVSELGTSVMTASALGDSTIGNATLLGSFTANTVVVGSTLRTRFIDTLVGNTSPLDIHSQTLFSSTSRVPIIIDNSAGPRVKVKNNNISWLMGLRGSAGTGTDAQFIIGVEGSDFAFRIGTNGTIYANNIILDSDSSSPTGVVRADRTINTSSGITGGGDLTADRTFSLDGQALAVHNLGTNGIIVRTGSAAVTSRSIVAGTGIKVTNGSGVSGNPTVAVTSDVVVLAGAQTITGTKTFSSTIQGSISGNAETVTNGVYTSGNQTINGVKTFTGGLVITNGSPTINFVDTDNSDYSVHVNSGNWYVLNQNGSGILGTDQSGNFWVTGNVTAYSDARLKSNVRTIDSALDKVSALRGVYYDKDSQAGVGVIAQEVEAVIPEAVQDGEYKSVAYGNLVGVLIEAIKELKAEIEELKGNQ